MFIAPGTFASDFGLIDTPACSAFTSTAIQSDKNRFLFLWFSFFRRNGFFWKGKKVGLSLSCCPEPKMASWISLRPVNPRTQILLHFVGAALERCHKLCLQSTRQQEFPYITQPSTSTLYFILDQNMKRWKFSISSKCWIFINKTCWTCLDDRD